MSFRVPLRCFTVVSSSARDDCGTVVKFVNGTTKGYYSVI